MPSTVPANTPVVTLQGLCKAKTAQGACKTVITRGDLDRFVKTFAPEALESARSRMAVQYARTLAYSIIAEQQGLDKTPALQMELELQLKLVRMRILASAYLQKVQQHTAAVTGVEVERYYQAHQDQYEQAQVRRVSVPFAVPTANGRPLDHAAVQSEMAPLRDRAAAGEDLNQLQQQAYRDLHIQTTPPQVNPLLIRRSNLQGEEAKVLDLKNGDVSPLLDLPAAFAFVKLESKLVMPFDAVRQEIEAGLRRDRMQNALSKLNKLIGSQFNLEYFAMPSQPDLFGPAPISPAVTHPAIRQGADNAPPAHPAGPRN